MSTIKIYETAKIIGIEHIQFGQHIIIDDFVFIYAKKSIRIGNYVHIAGFSSVTGGEEFTMGDFSCISWGVRVFTASDDFTNGGFGNSTVPEEYRNVRRSLVQLGRFAIIGANSVILPGVKIGEGVTVGANSVVTKNLDPWGVYIGNQRIAERNKAEVLANYKKFISSKFDQSA